MTQFTHDNFIATDEEIDLFNEAFEILWPEFEKGWPESHLNEAEQALRDGLCNAFSEGCFTADDLINNYKIMHGE